VVNQSNDQPPFEGGSQPVPERQPEMPQAGRTVGQTIVVVIGVIVLIAALAWILVPLLGT
jgi:flagellar biogenesis protein FliO